MDDRAALLEIRRILAEAMPPDSGATVGQLLGDLSGVLARVGLDPIASIESLDSERRSAEVIPLRPRP